MGTPNVFSWNWVKFFGVGLSYMPYRVEGVRTFEIGITLPFIYINIFFFKGENNKWF